MGITGWRLFSLVMAALLGGYVMAAATGLFISSILPTTPGNAVLTGHLVSYAVYTGVVIWVFTVRHPLRAWLGLMLSAGIMTMTSMILADYSA